MKNSFRLMGTMFIIVLTCVNLVSCNNDKEKEAEKRIVEVEINHPSGVEIWTYHYDDKGRLASSERTLEPVGGGEKQTSTIQYTWENGSIKQNGTEVDFIHTLTDGLITRIETTKGDEKEKVVLSYNSNQLVAIENETNGKPFFSETCTWEGNKIVGIIYEDKETGKWSATHTISYDNQTCKGYFPDQLPNLSRYMDECPLAYAHPELFGLKSNQLPVRFTTEHEIVDYCIEVSYTFTEEGYIEQYTLDRTGTMNGETMKSTSVYKFKWQ